MALIVQNDQGTVPGANAYISVQEFKDYHDARGNSYAGQTDQQIETGIVRATDYLDGRFRFVGKPLYGRDQTTAWPRSDAWDCSRRYVTGIPREVKDATAEYALRALAADLLPDPIRDPSGAPVLSKSETVGPISESVTYVGGSVFVMPKYPAADSKLVRACLVISGGNVVRA